jgi:FlaA1/EpsC-like NDP-sugar epimerase
MNIENLFKENSHFIISEQVKNLLKDKVILITGAAGSIGNDITKILAQQSDCKLILLDQAESALFDLQQDLRLLKFKNYRLIVGDICDVESMTQLFSEYSPDIVYHVAAYKHVPLMENHPFEAVKVNVLGTKIIADLSEKFKVAHFVLVSTDKAVNPASVMGASKRVAELYVSSLNQKQTKRFKIVRFGNVPNSNGSVIPLFRKQLKTGGPLTITDKDVTRYFIQMSSACHLLLEAVLTVDCDLLIGHMGIAVNIYDLGIKFINAADLKYPEDIEIELIGLRPGEKLHEELTYKEELLIEENTSKIKKYNTTGSANKIKLIVELCSLKAVTPAIEIVTKLKEIVPEYISNNSKYEILDSEI